MRSEYLSIIQVTGDYVLSTDDPDGLFFDPGKFRANKEVVILKMWYVVRNMFYFTDKIYIMNLVITV